MSNYIYCWPSSTQVKCMSDYVEVGTFRYISEGGSLLFYSLIVGVDGWLAGHGMMGDGISEIKGGDWVNVTE